MSVTTAHPPQGSRMHVVAAISRSLASLLSLSPLDAFALPPAASEPPYLSLISQSAFQRSITSTSTSTMKSFFLVAAVATFAAVNAADCEILKLAPAVRSESATQCTTDSTYTFLPPSPPTAEQLPKICASTACKQTLADVTALGLGECTVRLGADAFELQPFLKTFQTACAGASVAVASTGSGSSAGSATVTTPAPAPAGATAAPSTTTSAPSTSASSGSSTSSSTVPTPAPSATTSAASAVTLASSAVVLAAAAAFM